MSAQQNRFAGQKGFLKKKAESTMPLSEKYKGFTLIELIVVITLISIMLGFAIPRFQNIVLNDDARKASQWIMLTVSSLKERALREQIQYILNIDMNENRLWITNETMAEDQVQAAMSTGYTLPPDIHVEDVEYPDFQRLTAGQVQIHFYKKGYSDQVIVHLIDNDTEQRSLWIEPFLQQVKLYEKYVSFEASI